MPELPPRTHLPIAIAVAVPWTAFLLWFALTPNAGPWGITGVMVGVAAGVLLFIAVLASLDKAVRPYSRIVWWGVLALGGFSLLASSIGR